jgi:WD40 repeat protein
MPIRTRTFRVFVSSTFEDLKAERNALQRTGGPGAATPEVFPKLRKLCEANGARFQAIDLRWGVRDEAALDQKTMEICLREIERCQRTGIKPNFIVLLGQRYGWLPLPARIEACEFDAVRDRVAGAKDRARVERWYERDNNALPPQYRLKPRAGRWVDPKRWQKIEARLHGILLDAARTAGLSEQALVKYWASATHQEILKGLGATPEDRRHVFVFCRQVPDEACDPELVSLKSFLRAELPAGNILSYDPNDLKGLCQEVERALRTLIESETAGLQSRPALALEIQAHDDFAMERALVFGRDNVLATIAEYVRAGGGRTFVLHGVSGSGKSAVMAQASERAQGALASAVVIRRFIGATPESSSGLTLLRSLSQQIGEVYGSAADLPVDFEGVARVFRERLGLATSARPLVVFLDALDQLGKDDPARSLNWLGGALPPHCRMVVSTTDLVPALNGCQLLELERLSRSDAATALDYWLDSAGRSLQPAQWERLLAAFHRCGLPLYLKLAFEEARSWPSNLPAKECLLGEGVEGVIDTLLNRLSLEGNHGPLLVSRSLGYLAAARYGLTEDEMLDVLSDDEKVWEDFFARRHHDPPERRLPVIVWSRLFLDLEPYLSERSAPGGTVTSFYHRQLAEQTAARFLAGEDGRLRHASLAGYFAAKPAFFDLGQSRPNARKAAELIHHQLGAKQVDEAGATLTDIEFVAAKCGAGMVFDLQTDYSATISLLPEAQREGEEERLRQERLDRWTREIVEYSRATNPLVNPASSTPPLPEIPRSVELWSDQRLAAERQRIIENPNRLDRLRCFGGFVQAERHALVEYGQHPGFVIQQAVNYAPAGLVHDAAKEKAGSVAAPMLLRQWPSNAVYNPKPALVRTLEGLGGVLALEGRLVVTQRPQYGTEVWDSETGARLLTLEGNGWAGNMSVAPDGRRAAAASEKTVRIWDLETGTCLRTLEGHSADVRSVSMTPDGRMAVSASADKTLRVWDLETGVCLRTLSEGAFGFGRVSVTPDGQRAVSVGHAVNPGGLGIETRVWDLETGACLRTLNGCLFERFATFDGRRALSRDYKPDHAPQLWDLETGECLLTLKGHTNSVFSMDVTPDGRLAVSGSKDHTVRVWDLETGVCLRTLEGHLGEIGQTTITPDGRRAVSADGDGTVQVWDLETGACLRTVEEHLDGVDRVQVTPDGRRAVSSSYDYMLRVWDPETMACLQVLDGIFVVSITPDGRRAVSSSDDSSGRRAVSGGDDNSGPWYLVRAWDHLRAWKLVRVWDLESGKCLHTLNGHSAVIRSVSVTPDGRLAVSASKDKTLRVWDLEMGTCLRTLEGHSGEVRNVGVTPDGRLAVSASREYKDKMRVWDLEAGVCLRTLEGHSHGVADVSIMPCGRRAVSVGQDGDYTVRMWDLETGACLWMADAGFNHITSLSVTPDGKLGAATNLSRTPQAWDLETGKSLGIFEGHRDAVGCVSVTPDGRHVVSASKDKTLRVWDLETHACLAIERADSPWNTVAAVSASRIIAGSSFGEVALFELHGVACGPVIYPAVQAEHGGAEPPVRSPWYWTATAVPEPAPQAIDQHIAAAPPFPGSRAVRRLLRWIGLRKDTR